MDNDDWEKIYLENLDLAKFAKTKFAKTKLFPVLNSETYS